MHICTQALKNHLFPVQEWIATCPIMQLKLVVLAGARVPSYRRFMMPLLSVAVLLCGTASMFTGDALRFGWYGFGLCCSTRRLFDGFAQAQLAILCNSSK